MGGFASSITVMSCSTGAIRPSRAKAGVKKCGRGCLVSLWLPFFAFPCATRRQGTRYSIRVRIVSCVTPYFRQNCYSPGAHSSECFHQPSLSSYILNFHRCDLTQILRIRRAVCGRVLETGLVPAAVFGNRGTVGMMVAKAVVSGSSNGNRDQDGIVVHVCNVIGNGTGRKKARVMSRSCSSFKLFH